MISINKRFRVRPRTHEGARAVRFTPEQELRRALMNCLLRADQFYEDGVSIAERIAGLVTRVDPEEAAALAVEAREKMKLRHAPLLVVREMARYPRHRLLVAETLERIVQRPDELTEFLNSEAGSRLLGKAEPGHPMRSISGVIFTQTSSPLDSAVFVGLK